MNKSQRIALGSDHAGLEVKESIKDLLISKGYDLVDFGTNSKDSCDYPDFAKQVAQGVADEVFAFGFLICRTGIGMSMAANTVHGARAALAMDVETVKLTREHNNANILCLPGELDDALLVQLVEAFLLTEYAGGRHEQRLRKGSGSALANNDPELYNILQREARRQRFNIELIASENFTSRSVQECQGSLLTNKYAEGYPGKRWYGGCEFVDEAESLAIARAKALFGAEHVNVQPHSGSQANMAVYFSVLKAGDTILTMDLAHGGHLTHGHKANFSGKIYNVVHYGVEATSEHIDYDALQEMAEQVKPAMITAGASAYPREIDFARMAQIARSVGAYLFVDMAHIAGLVAAGVHPNPVPHADFVTSTTHKSLRGPRGGIIMCREEFAKKVDAMVFPGIQGGPLMHVIAAKAVCLGEALKPSFVDYQKQVIANAKTMAAELVKYGYRVVSGGTDNHLLLLDLRSVDMDGMQAQLALDEAGITVNKNSIPYDTGSPMKPSGIRIGTPAVTTRGFKQEEIKQVAAFIHAALSNADNPEELERIREQVYNFSSNYPLPE